MFGSIVAAAILLVIAGVVGTAIMMFMQRDKKEFGFRTIFTTYFYLVSIISLLAAFFGMSSITKAVASDVMGRNFSYYSYTPEYFEPISKETPALDDRVSEEQLRADNEKMQKAQIENQYQEDLFNGISMLVVGLLFLGVHILGWRKLETAEERAHSVLYKAYIIVQLAAFSVITLVALPMAISQWLRFAMGKMSAENVVMPGEAVSIALWSTPIWLFFIWLTIRTLRRQAAK